MRISEARYEGGELILTADREAIGFVKEFKAGEYEIKRIRKKRSLDMNSYCWVLIGKIAEATGLKMTDIYRTAIKDVGGVWDIIQVRNNAVNKFRENWERQGLGWQTDILMQGETFSNVCVYYGSSTYDSMQMARLIDLLVQDAKSLNIETLPPAKLEAMMEDWRK